MEICTIDLNQDFDLVKSVAKKAFAATPDSNLDEWIDFEEMKKLILDNRGICLKAIDNDEVIGMTFSQQESPVNGNESKEKWVIIIAAVDPDFSGKGIGTELLKGLEIELIKRNVKKLFVYTNKEDETVINFYKKNGYEDAGWIRDYQYGKGNSAVFLLKYL